LNALWILFEKRQVRFLDSRTVDEPRAPGIGSSRVLLVLLDISLLKKCERIKRGRARFSTRKEKERRGRIEILEKGDQKRGSGRSTLARSLRNSRSGGMEIMPLREDRTMKIV